MSYILQGKKCGIWENVSEDDRYIVISNDEEIKVQTRRKNFEVMPFDENSECLESFYIKDWPTFEPLGWDTLEEAKIFFLLIES